MNSDKCISGVDPPLHGKRRIVESRRNSEAEPPKKAHILQDLCQFVSQMEIDKETRKVSCPDSCPSDNPGLCRRSSRDICDEYFNAKQALNGAKQKQLNSAGDNDVLSQSVSTRLKLKSEAVINDEDRLSKSDSFEEDMDTDTLLGAKMANPISRTVRSSAFATQRSLSSEGYDAFDSRDRKLDTQALLFDSTPDLTEEENYRRFPSIRVHRRGAICYDCHSSLVTCDLSDSTTSL